MLNFLDCIGEDLMNDVRLHDIEFSLYWSNVYELAYAYSNGNNTTSWSNPDYGYKSDNIRPKKLYFKSNFAFDIGYVFDLELVLTELFDDKYPSFIISEISSFIKMEKEAIKFNFIYEHCCQPYDRMEMGFDYGYWTSNDYYFNCLNDKIPDFDGVILKCLWNKKEFKCLLLSLLYVIYKCCKWMINDDNTLNERIEWIKDYTPYLDGEDYDTNNLGVTLTSFDIDLDDYQHILNGEKWPLQAYHFGEKISKIVTKMKQKMKKKNKSK